MRVLLLANSQGTDAGVEESETYPVLVRRELEGEHEVALRPESGWTVRDFAAAFDELVHPVPDLIVLQVGIVECARRILSEREKWVLARLPGSSRLTKALHDHRPAVIRLRHRLRLDTRVFAPHEFEAALDAFVTRAGAAGAEVLVAEIPPFGAEYASRYFPLVNEDIAIFNGIIRRYRSFSLLAADESDTAYQAGTVHFTADGHARAASRVVAAIRAVRSKAVA